jgi:hypothetical protein
VDSNDSPFKGHIQAQNPSDGSRGLFDGTGAQYVFPESAPGRILDPDFFLEWSSCTRNVGMGGFWYVFDGLSPPVRVRPGSTELPDHYDCISWPFGLCGNVEKKSTHTAEGDDRIKMKTDVSAGSQSLPAGVYYLRSDLLHRSTNMQSIIFSQG